MTLERIARDILEARANLRAWQAQHHELTAYSITPIDMPAFRRSMEVGKRLHAKFDAAIDRLEATLGAVKGADKK